MELKEATKVSNAALVLAALIVFQAAAAAAEPYEKAARDISRVANRTNKRRLAVLPFVPVSGGDSQGCLALAERLTARLAEQDGIEIVERTLLEKVLEEQGLGTKGLVDARQAHEVGRILGVDSIVTGTFMSLSDGQLEVNARLIDAASARILGVSTLQVPQDWHDSGFSTSFDMNVPPPDIGDSGPVLTLRSGFRDALSNQDGCSGWEERVDELQSAVLELKSRYWAGRLQERGFSTRNLTRNPGSEIRSMSLRQDFFRRVRDIYEAGWRGSLTPQESSLLETSDRAVSALMETCYR
ncbi:MAG TPA: hypothetical protein DCM05_17510 [Elusimicrobia bacterium]|nr:hypothetical protein [Elusimicrobiota bacterium]